MAIALSVFGNASPYGSDKQIAFNNAGVETGDSDLTWTTTGVGGHKGNMSVQGGLNVTLPSDYSQVSKFINPTSWYTVISCAANNGQTGFNLETHDSVGNALNGYLFQSASGWLFQSPYNAGTTSHLPMQFAIGETGGGNTPIQIIEFVSGTAYRTRNMYPQYLPAASTGTGQPSMNIASSAGSTPASPSDGDLWYDGTNLRFRVGGVTKTIVTS